MKYIFATTALASALAFGTFAAGNLAKAEDTNAPPCVGEQCPQGGGMKGGGEQMPGMKGSGEENQGGYKKRLRGTGQNNQVEDQSGDDQGMPRKKRLKAQGNDNDDVDVNVQGRVKVGRLLDDGKARWEAKGLGLHSCSSRDAGGTGVPIGVARPALRRPPPAILTPTSRSGAARGAASVTSWDRSPSAWPWRRSRSGTGPSSWPGRRSSSPWSSCFARRRPCP